MYIGNCKNVKLSYTRFGDDKPLIPDNSGNAVIFRWQWLYNTGFEIHAALDREYYVGSVTIPLLEKSKICGAKIIVGGKTVGTFTAGTGSAVGGRITVNAGVFTDELTVRIESGVYDVAFTEPEISVFCSDTPILWPIPQKQEYFKDRVKISCVSGMGDDASFAADFLTEQLNRRFGDIICADGVPINIFLDTDEAYAKERFTVSVTDKEITLRAGKRIALLYAVNTFISIGDGGSFPICNIDSTPSMEFRGFHMGLPKVSNIEFTKRLFRDVLLPLGYNTLFFEIIGCMEFERHPEITENWRRCLENDPKFPHWALGCEGETISKKEVSDLIDFARELGFEIIPEVQSLGHVQWLTNTYPEIAETVTEHKKVDDTRSEDARPTEKYPHCYCPSNPKSYEILFDVMDEIIEVTKPQRFVHIGHDEVYYMGLCDKCKDVPHDQLFARDVIKIYEHLKSLGYRTMMWSDMLQPDTDYKTPPAIKLLPKDIVMLDFIWYFHFDKDIEENLYAEDFDVIAGNFYSSHYPRYRKRAENERFIGGEVSTWYEVNERKYAETGKLWDLCYSAEMLWNYKNYDDAHRKAFSHVIGKYLQPRFRDLVRDKYNIKGYDVTLFEPAGGSKDGIPDGILEEYPSSVIADGVTVNIGGCFDRFIIEHTALEKEMRVPNQPLKACGEYTVKYSDGTTFTVPAEYAGNVMKYDSSYGFPFPEQVYRHAGYVGTWFSDPVYEGKDCHGNNVLVMGFVCENPNPDKEVESISYRASEDDIARVVLCGIKGLKKNN